MQKQKGLLTARLVVEADGIPAIKKFIDHLAKKPHLKVIERTDTAFATDEGDRPATHLSIERRVCWGNWPSDIRRDVAHSLRLSGSTASCSVIEVCRTVVETRSPKEVRVEGREEESGSQTVTVPSSIVSIEAAEVVEDPEFGEFDMLMAAQDHDALLSDAIIAARDEHVANTLIDWRDEQEEPEVETALANIETQSGEDSSTST